MLIKLIVPRFSFFLKGRFVSEWNLTDFAVILLGARLWLPSCDEDGSLLIHRVWPTFKGRLVASLTVCVAPILLIDCTSLLSVLKLQIRKPISRTRGNANSTSFVLLLSSVLSCSKDRNLGCLHSRHLWPLSWPSHSLCLQWHYSSGRVPISVP